MIAGEIGFDCGRARILPAADGGFAAAVIGMAGLALVPIELSARRDAGEIVLQRIGGELGVVVRVAIKYRCR
jgi:hypothetical protein